MSDLFVTGDNQNLINGIRTGLGVSGMAALLFGVLILVWPGHTAAAVVAVFVIAWAAITGLVNLSLSIFSRTAETRHRVGTGVLGVVFLVAAVIALANLSLVTQALGVLIGIVVGVAWLIEGVVVLFGAFRGGIKVWSVLYGIVSILAGGLMIASPLWGATLLWLILGVSLVVVGILQIIRALRFGR